MWPIVLLGSFLLLEAACNRNSSKKASSDSPPMPNPAERYDLEDHCSDSFAIERTYHELQGLKTLLDGNKYSIQKNEIFEDSQGKPIEEIINQSSFPAGVHFSDVIQSKINQLEGRRFYFCINPENSNPISFYRFANHYNDLMIAKSLYSNLESDKIFKSSFTKDKVGCTLKRTMTSGTHDETGRVKHDPNQSHNIIQTKFEECFDLSDSK